MINERGLPVTTLVLTHANLTVAFCNVDILLK